MNYELWAMATRGKAYYGAMESQAHNTTCNNS